MFNHAFDIAFSVVTSHKGKDVTGAELRAGLQARIVSMPDAEFLEACGLPFDTYIETDPGKRPGRLPDCNGKVR